MYHEPKLTVRIFPRKEAPLFCKSQEISTTDRTHARAHSNLNHGTTTDRTHARTGPDTAPVRDPP